MGKDTKSDRRPNAPSSSARAAVVLASKAGGFVLGGLAGATASSPGFGFGDPTACFLTNSGPTSASSSAAGSRYASGDVTLPLQVDGEIAQCFRHLSKKDSTTKIKALQNLRALLPSRSTTDLLAALSPWVYVYSRLILDSSRVVRQDTAATLATVLQLLGKAVAPQLKSLMGPWWLAMHDTYPDAADASRAAFAAMFPEPRRQLDVVLYCRNELVLYLMDQLAATPQQLGDPRKDSAEELEDRHERVQAGCMAALAALVDRLATPAAGGRQPAAAESAGAAVASAGTSAAPAAAGSASATERAAVAAGREELLASISDVICRPGFWKDTAGAKSTAIRRASYGLAGCVALRAPELLSGCLAESAVCVLGALGEKEAANHGAMWEAVLAYGKCCLGRCWARGRRCWRRCWEACGRACGTRRVAAGPPSPPVWQPTGSA
ncbi:hypothetical protein Agub_g4131 [Astrephomene gubernaculifera]|uniref:E3 ubiquitin-protein ligase listerin n=1 Tax=Astrephomene gubernaculifera TaxID=47775 RepID=A0AAD3DJQ3_9CHLO|nr:hypothetical protein Agub_g4131 [Astrephomene gubernaculifera]